MAMLVSPDRRGFSGYRSPGQKNSNEVYDSTGIHALQLLVAGLHGMATNPASKWFSISIPDENIVNDEEVRKYIADVEDIMWSRMYAPGTNMITALNEIYNDLGAFGTAILYIEWDDDERHLRFLARPVHEYVFAESNKGRIDTFFRRFFWTVRQAVQEWGEDGVSDSVRAHYRNGRLEERIEIIHAVYPREVSWHDKQETGEDNPLNMPVASCYFEYQTDHVLEEGGYPESPYAGPRWLKASGETMGRSQAMLALPDLKMLQAMSVTTIKTAQKMSDPPTVFPHEGMVNPIDYRPGGTIFARRGAAQDIMQLPVSGNLPITMDMMEGLRNRIRTMFFVDQLQFVNDTRMTATEVLQRTQERMRLLGPVIGRLESELLGPMIERVYGILSRMGELPEPPESLQGREYTVEYVSPISRAQRLNDADTLSQMFTYLGPYLENPETAQIVMQKLPVERLIGWLVDRLNIDPDLLSTAEEDEAAAQQAQIQQAAAMAGPMKDGAGAVNQLAQAANSLGGGQGIEGAISGMQGINGINGIMENMDPAVIEQLQQMGGGQ